MGGPLNFHCGQHMVGDPLLHQQMWLRNVASDASCTRVKFSRYAPLLREVSPYLLCRGCVETRPGEDIPRFREHAKAHGPAVSHALCLLAKLLNKVGQSSPL